ncbi:type VI secretion system tip protein VgrG [Nitrospirillum sp. BR 11164]|uniref:type VI secretion system Vgr family protein n=1 Tax=Nitrospirillum sp. BR 11164 TaxID=3104324 RepID=UPI002AFDD8D2|nr:type VI secretion system tip protein VgrG [Nitrospirillum sp. BR 11164]MEA1649092.1 type VI secretion system tip protein VgrG [Nitrospirillum sp. BR 11164]
MDGYTQAERLLGIESPLGPDQLLLEALEGTEGVSTPFEFRATVRAMDDNVDPAALVAQSVDLKLRLDEGSYRVFNGVVASLTGGHAASRGQRHYVLRVVPRLWFLTRTSDCRIFQNKTTLDILETIFGELGVTQYDFSGVSAPPPREYCVQYRETDFAFVSRLMEEDGLYYFFRHEAGKHTLVLGSQTSAYQTGDEPLIPFSATSSRSNHITEWHRSHAYQASAWAMTDYNFQTSKLDLKRTVPTVSTYSQDPQHEHFDYPGLHDSAGDGERRAKLAMQAEEVERETVQGASDCRSMTPCGRFQLTDHPVAAENGAYVVLSASHRASDLSYEGGGASHSGYANHFTCLPAATPFVPRRVTPRPTISGLQTAVVVGPKGQEIHTDKHGRVKVQFFWDRRGQSNEASSCWVRVAQGWAGRGFGAQTIPRMGMEVVVAFLEGNPDRPVILGSVPNSETTAPLGLPAQKTQTTFRTASSPGGGGFNLFTLEDKAGAEEIAFHSQKDLSMVVQNNAFETVTKASVRQAGQVLAFKVGNSSIQFTPDNIILSSNGSTAVLDKDGIRHKGGKIWLNMKEPAPAKPPDQDFKAEGSAWAANKTTGPVTAKVLGAEGSITAHADPTKATVDAKGEIAMARISAKGKNSWGEVSGGMDIFAVEGTGHAGVTTNGLGAQGEAKAAMQRVTGEGIAGDLNKGGLGVKGTGELFSADAKGQALLGDDGRYVGAALGGKAGARVAQASAEENVTIPIGWLPGVPDDWTIAVKGEQGVSAGSAGIGAGGYGYYDRVDQRTHAGIFGDIEAGLGIKTGLDASIGPAPKGGAP